jgi:acyl-CoA thioester hydrolase
MATRQKIRYSDCDPQGIVFNGNYPRYWDDALTDWFEDVGFGGKDMGGTGVDVVAARLEMDFQQTATMGDTLETTIEVGEFGTTSMTVVITTRRVSDEVVVTSGREVLVFVDPVTFRPVEVPDRVRSELAPEST